MCGGSGLLVTGEAMLAKRLALGVSGGAVARAMGKSRQYLHWLENAPGEHWTADLAKRYAVALREAVLVKEHKAALKAQQRGEQRKG